MPLVLRAIWTALVMICVVALSVGINKSNYFELDPQARIDLFRGLQIVRVASVLVVALGILAIPAIKAPVWSAVLLALVAAIGLWTAYNNWFVLVVVAVIYPLTLVALSGYWVAAFRR